MLARSSLARHSQAQSGGFRARQERWVHIVCYVDDVLCAVDDVDDEK